MSSDGSSNLVPRIVEGIIGVILLFIVIAILLGRTRKGLIVLIILIVLTVIGISLLTAAILMK